MSPTLNNISPLLYFSYDKFFAIKLHKFVNSSSFFQLYEFSSLFIKVELRIKKEITSIICVFGNGHGSDIKSFKNLSVI